MAYTGKSLSDGQVATTWGTIYGPSGVIAVIKSVDFYNTNATKQTLELRILRSGSTARMLITVQISKDEALSLLDGGDTLVLSDGDALQAQTTTATAVDFTITGAEE